MSEPREVLEIMARAWYVAGLAGLDDDEEYGRLWDDSAPGFKRISMIPLQAALRELLKVYDSEDDSTNIYKLVHTIIDITELEL